MSADLMQELGMVEEAASLSQVDVELTPRAG
jgi:hypothetical protein